MFHKFAPVLDMVKIKTLIHKIILFFLNDTAPTEIYPLPLPAALPISPAVAALLPATAAPGGAALATARGQTDATARVGFWARFKRLLAGESAAAEPPPASAASPVRAPRRDGGARPRGAGGRTPPLRPPVRRRAGPQGPPRQQTGW